MELYKKLKWKSIVRNLLIGLLPLAFAAVCIRSANVQWALQKPRSLYSVPVEAMEGAYVTVENPDIYGGFDCQRSGGSSGKVLYKDYVMKAGEDTVCGLRVTGESMDKADALLAGSTPLDEGEKPPFVAIGVMRPMSDETLARYHEELEREGLTPEGKNLPLYLDTRESFRWEALLFGLALVGVAAAFVIYAVMGKYQKQLMEAANALSGGKPEAILAQVARLRGSKPLCRGVWVGSDMTYLELDGRQYLYPNPDVCWAYMESTRRKAYGRGAAGKTNTLTLRTMDGRLYAIQLPKDEVLNSLRELSTRLPGCVLGYSEELQKLYLQNRGKFAEIASIQRSQKSE